MSFYNAPHNAIPLALIRSSLLVQHMREVAERRQQLELEHEQALAILKFKQDEIKRLQRVWNAPA